MSLKPDGALHPEILGLLETLDRVDSAVSRLTANLTEAQWRWSPDKNTWSLAQVLDHLNRGNGAVLPLFEQAVSGLKQDAPKPFGAFRYSGFERMFIRMVSPNPPFKVPVPPPFVPQAEATSEVLPRFEAIQAGFRACFLSANGRDLGAVKVTSPASSLVRLRLGAYMQAMMSHELYHLGQMEALCQNPQFPTS